MDIRNHVDFNRVQIRNASIQPLGTAPNTPVTGQAYYDTATKAILLYDGSAWGNKATDSLLLNGQNGAYYLNLTNATGNIAIATVTGLQSALDGKQVAGSYQAHDGTLDALALLDATPGLVEMTGADTFAKRALGTSATTSVLTRGDGDARYAPIAGGGYQAADATLTTLAGLSWASGTQVVVFTANDTASFLTVGASSGNILDKASGDSLYLAKTATAADSSMLNTQPGSYYLSRANHTGTQIASTISNLAATVQGYTLDLFAAPAADISVNSHKITGLASPTNPADAATRQFVLDQVQSSSTGISVKTPVRVVAQSNINIATGGLLTIDGVTLLAGDRVLLISQTNATQNGVYIAAAGAWGRAATEDEQTELKGAFWLTNEGTVGAGTQWIVNNSTAPVIGVDNITIVQFGAVISYTASTGVQKVGNDFQIKLLVSNSGLTVSSSGLGVDFTVLPKKYSATVGSGSSGTATVTHNLGTKDVVVTIRDTSNDAVVYMDVTMTDTNTVTISQLANIPTNGLRVTVIG